MPGKPQAELELTYNFETPEGGYEIGTGYGHIALTVDDLDATLASRRGASSLSVRPIRCEKAGANLFRERSREQVG